MGRPGVVPLFVGNISFDTNETMLHALFSEVGPVMAVRCAASWTAMAQRGVMRALPGW